MRNYQRLIQQVESALDRINPREMDEVLVSQIAQYHCVRLSGILESAIRDCISQSFEKNSHPRAARYIGRTLADFQNPKPEKIRTLYGNIDKEWLDKIETFWSDEIRDSIGSIVGNRNKIAHGDNTTVTIIQVKQWLGNVKKFCAFIEAL